MFETFAVVTTFGLIIIFIALYRIDRAGRREEQAAEAEHQLDRR